MLSHSECLVHFSFCVFRRVYRHHHLTDPSSSRGAGERGSVYHVGTVTVSVAVVIYQPSRTHPSDSLLLILYLVEIVLCFSNGLHDEFCFIHLM